MLLPKIAATLLILAASGALLSFAFLPNNIYSRQLSASYYNYIHAPSEETKRTYDQVRDRVNRPFFYLQYTSGLLGIALPFLLARVWRKHRMETKWNPSNAPQTRGCPTLGL